MKVDEFSSIETMSDGCKIHYSYHSSEGRPTLVFSNSLGTSKEMWKPQWEVLRQQFNVLLYDSRGHGGSDSPAGSYSIDRLGCDLVELLNALQLERVHFCGLSIGGMIGQWLVNRHPQRVESLVLANTSAYIGPSSLWQNRIQQILDEGMGSVWDSVRSRWFTESFCQSNADVVRGMKSMFLNANVQGYTGCCAAIRDMDLRNIVGNSDIPVLVIAGKQDLATPLEHSYDLLDKNKNALLVEIDAGHLSNIEQPEEFTNRVVEFLIQN